MSPLDARQPTKQDAGVFSNRLSSFVAKMRSRHRHRRADEVCPSGRRRRENPRRCQPSARWNSYLAKLSLGARLVDGNGEPWLVVEREKKHETFYSSWTRKGELTIEKRLKLAKEIVFIKRKNNFIWWSNIFSLLKSLGNKIAKTFGTLPPKTRNYQIKSRFGNF